MSNNIQKETKRLSQEEIQTIKNNHDDYMRELEGCDVSWPACCRAFKDRIALLNHLGYSVNDIMNPRVAMYRVSLKEHLEDSFTIHFDCEAEDYDDAFEQAEVAYPGHHYLVATRLS